MDYNVQLLKLRIITAQAEGNSSIMKLRAAGSSVDKNGNRNFWNGHGLVPRIRD